MQSSPESNYFGGNLYRPGHPALNILLKPLCRSGLYFVLLWAKYKNKENPNVI